VTLVTSELFGRMCEVLATGNLTTLRNDVGVVENCNFLDQFILRPCMLSERNIEQLIVLLLQLSVFS